MSKIIYVFTLFLATTFLMPETTSAQTTAWTWNYYGLKFTTPSTHSVKKNSSEAFESGDNQTWLEIYPYRDYNATPQSMVKGISSNRGFYVEAEGAYNSGKFQGYWLRCTSSKYPAWKFWIIAFIDPGSDVNFYSIIWWKKGNQYAYNQAYNMSYSFH